MLNELESVFNILDKSSKDFKRKLLAIIKKGQKLNRIELARLVAQIDFWKGLDLETQVKLGLKELFVKYDKQIEKLFRYADKENIRNAMSINSDFLETMKYFRGKELLGRAQVYADYLKNVLMNSIVSGKTFAEIKNELDNLPLTSAQINTVISTGFSDYGRSIIKLSYEDSPSQRFLYFGTVIPTSSKQCTWLLMNQKMEGELLKDIEAGIETPYGIINWSGRVPNYNCDDRWYPVTPYLVKTIKEFQKRNRKLAEQVLNK